MSDPKIDAVLSRLERGVLELTTSAAWQRALEFQARFHRYSWHNTILIMQQRPDATHVAGYSRWKELGRQVRKGERGIQILAPLLRTATPGEEGMTGPDGKVMIGVRLAYVFDVVQTAGDPIPEVPIQRLTAEAPEKAWVQLGGLARQLGFTTERTAAFPDDRNGDCNVESKRIRVRRDLSPAMAVKTLTHELAHALLHQPGDDLTRGIQELEAESVAYVVCGELGIDSSAYSFGYVATWQGGDAATVRDAISTSGHRIRWAAREVMKALGLIQPEPQVQLQPQQQVGEKTL